MYKVTSRTPRSGVGPCRAPELASRGDSPIISVRWSLQVWQLCASEVIRKHYFESHSRPKQPKAWESPLQFGDSFLEVECHVHLEEKEQDALHVARSQIFPLWPVPPHEPAVLLERPTSVRAVLDQLEDLADGDRDEEDAGDNYASQRR